MHVSSRSGGMVKDNMTKNPSYMATGELVTCFTTGTLADGGKEQEDCSYAVLPSEAIHEDKIDADELYANVHK